MKKALIDNKNNNSKTKQNALSSIQQYISKTIKLIYSLFPFVVSLCYYIPFYQSNQNEHPILDALYSSVTIYSGKIEGDIHITLLLHIARFMALSTTLSILINALNKLSDIMNRLKLFSKKAYAVYGDSQYTSNLCKDIGKLHSVNLKTDDYVKANNYIIMFSDDKQNLEFYSKYLTNKDPGRVILMVDNIEKQNFMCKNVSIFSIPECCARLYWKQYYPESSEKIGIIGFGKIGQNILTFGLQMNIISTDQHFEYHIWGDSEEFISIHTELDKMDPDKIVFHNESWYSELDIISDMDRLILCGDESDNLSTLSKLLFTIGNKKEIYIYISNKTLINQLFGNDNNIHSFGSAEEIATKEIIINEETLKKAKAQHNSYAKKHNASPWDEQSVFIKYSNISSADYGYVIKRLYNNNVSVDDLAELEHIRWCRYLYLNNWVYGSIKDFEKRIHNCLVPYSELTEENKQKDTDSIKIKISEEL